MRIMVELTWSGGILADGEPDQFPEPDYEIVDADSGRTLVADGLTTYESVEARIARDAEARAGASVGPLDHAVVR